MPSGASREPIQPVGAYSVVSAIPATAVGSANGKSTSASISRRPGKRYRVSTQAASTPNTELISAPMKDAPKLSRYDARTRGADTVSQNACQPRPALRKKMVASGIRTISPRYARANPRASPNPGRTVRRTTLTAGPSLDLARLVELIEDPAIGEVGCLRLPPSAEQLVDREEIDLGKPSRVLRRGRRRARAVEVLAGDVLPLLRVQKLEVRLRDCAGPPLVHHLVDHRD